jgi:16S rRNA (guanine966-N2)-methyltransferase
MAAAVCIKNSRLIEDALKDEGVEVSAKVQIQSVQAFLDGSTGMFDVVFIDPPYEVSNAEVEKNLASLRERVTTGSWVLVERSARVDPFALDGYKLSEQKNFGDTVVYWLVPS